MNLKSLELSGFKSFPKKTKLEFASPITAIVGPNGSGKSNIAEAFRYALGEQSIKSMRGKRGEDLIWNGSKNSPKAAQAKVKVLFDNSNKIFDVDFEEVDIERVVARDSSGDYILNGSRVRLKDIIELLASAHIGASGHHIISQGEADRILNVSPTERKTMIEDALGLKIYQYKKEESLKKLARTKENSREVEGLRRELKPHLRFLKRQVEKIEKALSMRDKLKEAYKKYFAQESAYLSGSARRIENERSPLKKKSEELEEKLAHAKEVLEEQDSDKEESKKILEIEGALRDVRAKKDEHTRDLGRLEGQEAAISEAIERSRQKGLRRQEISVSIEDIRGLGTKIDEYVEKAEGLSDEGSLKEIIRSVRALVRSFISGKESEEGSSTASERSDEKRIEGVREKIDGVKKSVEEFSRKEEGLNRKYQELREKIEKDRRSGREAERAVFEITAEQNELRIALNALSAEEEKLKMEEEAYRGELSEAGILVGQDVKEGIKNVDTGFALSEPRREQEERKRAIEKMKIRLEDAGAGGGDEFLKEYEEMRERDEFLESELADLEKSAESLTALIGELDEKLASKFSDGLSKVNEQFQEFFSIMFGGGAASISLVKEKRQRRTLSDELGLGSEEADLDDASDMDDEEEGKAEDVVEGVEISVSLPRKRIKGLQMLSGGERALTSIALLFALSQVNPPPFLVLDETDAALDEANSRRYGDMIENLAKHSQLILITHNRETMSRAGILYGVTMSADGASQLLSVNFDEAVSVAA